MITFLIIETGAFDVSRICDIAWNTSPFESLVLPDGYKDLILSFVESQLKDGDTFDDVINGKGMCFTSGLVKNSITFHD